MNKVSCQYYKKLHQSFPLMGNEEKVFLDKFKKLLERYETNYPTQSFDDYIEFFGDPKDIISTYYEHIESEYVVNHMKSRNIIKYVSITLLCIFIVVSLILVFIRYKEYQDNKNNPYFYSEIIEETNDEVINE